MFRNESTLKSNPFDYINVDYSDPKEVSIIRDSVGRPIGAQPVDQFDSQPFMMGENGFRRSDIAILVSAESDDLKRSVAARLTEIKSNYPDQSLSDHELAQMAIPRSCQSAASMRDWAASLEKSGLSKVVDEFVSANSPKEDNSVINFEDSNSSSDAE